MYLQLLYILAVSSRFTCFIRVLLQLLWPVACSPARKLTMSNLVQEVTAPNGVTYEQPLGLFINNQWVASRNGQKIASINPA